MNGMGWAGWMHSGKQSESKSGWFQMGPVRQSKGHCCPHAGGGGWGGGTGRGRRGLARVGPGVVDAYREPHGPARASAAGSGPGARKQPGADSESPRTLRFRVADPAGPGGGARLLGSCDVRFSGEKAARPPGPSRCAAHREEARGGEGGGGGGLPAERGDFNNRPFTRCLRPPRRDIVPKRVFESTFACDRALVSPLGSANKTSAAHREEAGVPGGGLGRALSAQTAPADRGRPGARNRGRSGTPAVTCRVRAQRRGAAAAPAGCVSMAGGVSIRPPR